MTTHHSLMQCSSHTSTWTMWGHCPTSQRWAWSQCLQWSHHGSMFCFLFLYLNWVKSDARCGCTVACLDLPTKQRHDHHQCKAAAVTAAQQKGLHGFGSAKTCAQLTIALMKSWATCSVTHKQVHMHTMVCCSSPHPWYVCCCLCINPWRRCVATVALCS